MKFRSKYMEIEAEQFIIGNPLPFGKNFKAVVCFDGERWYVETIHGQKAFLSDGDWVIPERDGKPNQAYPCKPEVFEKRWEKIEDGFVMPKDFEERSWNIIKMGWLVIANVGDGHWVKQKEEWQKVAGEWRDEYNKMLKDFVKK